MLIEYLSLRSRSRLINLVFLLGVGCFGTLAQADMAYVTSGSNVIAIDTTNNSVVKTVTITGAVNVGIVVSPNGKHVYVVDQERSRVTVIDTGTYSVVDTIPVGEYPVTIALNPSGTRAYVPSREKDNVSVIDTSTFGVISVIPVGDWPDGITTSPSGKRVYVANSFDNTVSVIDTTNDKNTVIATVPVGVYPWSVVVSPDNKRVYVTNQGSGTISVIDATNDKNTVMGEVKVGEAPTGIAINPAGTRVYVTNMGNSSNVSVIDVSNDKNQVIDTVKVGYWPIGVAVTPNGKFVYVANLGSGRGGDGKTASVIDSSTNTVIATVTAGVGAGQVAIRQVTNCDEVTEIPVAECKELLRLYNETGGPNWTWYGGGWNQTNTPCSWNGVMCNYWDGIGHVVEIYQEDDNLSGSLPDLRLPYLLRLYLWGNQLTGNIPSFSGSPKLEELSLGGNQFTGSIPNL